MYVCMYACMHACTYVRTYVRTYVCMYVCMYACMYVCMYVCMCMCVYNIYIYIYIMLYIYIYIYILCMLLLLLLLYIYIYIYRYIDSEPESPTKDRRACSMLRSSISTLRISYFNVEYFASSLVVYFNAKTKPAICFKLSSFIVPKQRARVLLRCVHRRRALPHPSRGPGQIKDSR